MATTRAAMTLHRRLFAICGPLLIAAAALVLATPAAPARAASGPFQVSTGEYDFRDRQEPLVATDRRVDLWATVYRPSDLSGGAAPLLVFLHGNHGTCGRFDPSLGVRVDDRSDYTQFGFCTAGYTVTPNHLGYEYLAEELASWGYIVVSINANRGITAGGGVSGDSGLNLMRGRLILRHLALLSAWNRGVGSIEPPGSLGFNPAGTMDFNHVGLMGHSRGGEGARAALQQFRDQGSPFPALIGAMKIRSIFEIGPVDGQTGRVLDADGVDSMILLPSCDGDVSNLQGMRVFDRVFTRQGARDGSETFHGTAYVWGANHNAYNSEWLTSDSNGCRGASELFPDNGRSGPQQKTALKTLVPFFRATVGRGADASLAALFDPATPLPSALARIANVDRGYLPSPINERTRVLENFSRQTGVGMHGTPTRAVGVDVFHGAASYEHDFSTRVARVRWSGDRPDKRFFQVNLRARDADFSRYRTFAFRVALRCFKSICDKPASARGEMNFTVSLVTSGGDRSAEVRMTGRVRISRPVGLRFSSDSDLHSTLYTVEIPLTAFDDVNLKKIAGIRFAFENKPDGDLDIGALTVSTKKAQSIGTAGATVAADESPSAAGAEAPGERPVAADRNSLEVVRAARSERAGGGGVEGAVDIVLRTERSFVQTGSLPKLKVGPDTLEGGVISADGKSLTVTVPESRFDALEPNAEVTLDLQASSPVWRFGALPK